MVVDIPATARTCCSYPSTVSVFSHLQTALMLDRVRRVWDAAVTLLRAGRLKPRPTAPSSALATAYTAVTKIFTAGSVTSAGDVLSMNFLMDRDADHWARDLAVLKVQVGTCDTAAPISPTGALSGEFTWRCERGRVRGQVLLAPTTTMRIQSLSLARATP